VKYRKTNDRRTYLGASEAPAILGLSTWATEFDVWARKTQPQEESEGDNATKRGHILEGAVFEWGCKEVGASSQKRGGDFNSPPLQGPRPWAAFHPDGWLGNADKGTCVVEVKTARDGNGWEDDGIPAVYAAQVRYQLACCPDYIKGAYVFAYITFKDEFLWRYVERDPAQEEAMLDFCDAWWTKHVIGNVPPALDGSVGADSYLLNKHPKQTAPLEEADDEEARTVRELMAIRDEIKGYKAQEKRLTQLLKEHIGDREGVYVDGIGKATWKWQKGRVGFDTKSMADQFPNLYETYVTQGKETRVLRLPKAKK